jgi:hypothetical protein
VRSGEETMNVDIRFRAEPGHQVSGTIKGTTTGTLRQALSATLIAVSTGMTSVTTAVFPGSTSFVFSGVPDGTYNLIGNFVIGPTETLVSDPYRITVKGSDITGIELVPKPLASISGKLVLEPSKDPECKGKRKPVITETLIIPLVNREKAKPDEMQPLRLAFPTAPDEQGAFTFGNLSANQYGFDARLFAKYWYLQSVSLPALGKTAAASRSIDVARNWLTIKSGERVTGLSMTIAEGAASLKGTIATDGNSSAPKQRFLHLVPAERDNAEDVLRFFVTHVSENNSFGFSNLPPGKYWLLVSDAAKSNSQSMTRLRSPEEAETRVSLRREAEAAKTEIELKPCQNVDGYQLTFKPQVKAPNQP